MSNPKMTDWFPPEIKPVHVGVWEVLFLGGGGQYARWNRRYWCAVSLTVDSANQSKTKSVSCYNGEVIGWRGLASKPKGWKP